MLYLNSALKKKHVIFLYRKNQIIKIKWDNEHVLPTTAERWQGWVYLPNINPVSMPDGKI